MEKNVIAILGGFESDDTYTERALVIDDLDIIFERHTDSTTELPTTHDCWLDWMNEPLEDDPEVLGVVTR